MNPGGPLLGTPSFRTLVRIVGATAAVVLAVTLALGAVGATQGRPLPGATAASRTPGPPSILPSQTFRTLTVGSGTFHVGEWLTGRLPGQPFGKAQQSSMDGLMDEAYIAGVEDDAHWTPGTNLPPSVVIAIAETKTIVIGDPDATGRGLAAELARRLYRNLANPVVSDVRADPPGQLAGYPSVRGHATVEGTLRDGSTERSAVSVTVVELPDQSFFLYVEIRPRTMSPAATAAMDAALTSLSRP